MDNISAHISFSEATLSETAVAHDIPNIPDAETIKRMILVAEQCFEPIRLQLGQPIHIDDFYRCAELNALVGGVPNSQHQMGQAIDFSVDPLTNFKMFQWAIHNVDFDQIIAEFSDGHGGYKWIHISYVSKEANRHEVLTAAKDENGKTVYTKLPIANI